MNDLSRGETVLLIVLIWTTWIIFYWAGKNNLLGYMSDTISDFGKQLSESMRKTEEVKITKSEKDRLIELINQSGIICDNCPEYDCSLWAEHCADHLIANNVTIPPVSVGQTVYIIRRPKGSLPWIAECTVGEVHVEYTADGKVCWFKSHNYEALEEDIGAWVFLAREEAEQALKERSDSNV